MKKYKELLFVLLFVLFLVWELFVVDLYADESWNYGFSYSIYNGFLPYKDFNMVITPFFPFFMALFFKIFGFNILIFHIINSIILTIMSYIIYKLIGNKMLLVLLFLFIPLSNIFPSYNLFVLFLFVILCYLEKKNGDDYLIGLIIGLAILTKQSVGLCLLLPSLYYIKNLKKISKRAIGVMIPIIIFIIYLLISNTMMEFLDLCVFGLFDFTKNKTDFNYIYIFSIIYIFICIYMIYKDKRNIYNYYALIMFSMTLPLFDLSHFQLSLFCLLLIIFINYDIKIKVNLSLLFIGIIIGVGFRQFYDKLENGFIYPNNINNFEYRYISKNVVLMTNALDKYLDKYKDREIIYLTNDAYYIKISRNERLTYLDLINSGNHGYNGDYKLMKLVKSKKNTLFVINNKELDNEEQINKNVIKYVINNGKKIDKVGIYDIYKV